ncbi:MAG: hypothetical protein AUG51_23965 [Acidobacteria bacterium 13_1_20CM_3_53_8]|nr:MAG: hypothetical protein AUG51_23965 [Acidobacteria bacterium 13_1_20CM_3_53_8]
MPIIGRLDDQVDNVMIKPLGAGDRRAPVESAREHVDETKSTMSEDTPRKGEGSEIRERRRDELPVWLL